MASAIKSLMPNERLVYFGDTAHLPYGDKSTAAIQAYSIKICDVLLKKGCKIIVIACNSASSAAYDLVREYVGKKAVVFNVIDPVVSFIREHHAHETIGLIGTRQTIGSGVYQNKLSELGLQCKALATPLLAPMIEEGWIHNTISYQIISNYLGDEALEGIQSLILGCTHYPLIGSDIDNYYQGGVKIIDSAQVVAASVKAFLEFNYLLNHQAQPEEDEFMVSDLTPNFESATKLFFGERVPLERYPLWE